MTGDGSTLTPDSVPALVAEEYMIDPLSSFPSFLEIIMIHETQASLEQVLQSGIETMGRQLRLVAEQFARMQDETSNTSTTIHNNNNDTSRLAKLREGYLQWIRLHLLAWSRWVAVRLHSGLARYGPELQWMVRYAAERASLQSRRGLLAESVYGVRRSKVSNNNNNNRNQNILTDVPRVDRTRLALLVAFGPYMRQRLKRLYSQWKGRRHSLGALQKGMVEAIPVSLAIVRAVTVYCWWRFLLGQSHYTSVGNRLLRHVLRRVTQQDVGSSATTAVNTTNSPLSKERTLSPLLAAVSMAVTASWLLQMRQWYTDRYRHRLQSALRDQGDASTVIPPPPPSPHQEAVTVKGCPVCGRLHPLHPTVATTLGYVYCYSCISKLVQEQGRCPMTGMSLTDGELVRLYEPAERVPIEGPTAFNR